MDASPAGLYAHIPFCLTRCGYCDFNTYEGLGHLSGRYVSALVREAELAGPDWAGVPFVSLFLGGGTPTTLPVATLGGLIDALTARFGIGGDAEITVEANPDTVDEPYLRALRATGATRLSLGVQSFDASVLASLERLHSAESARKAFGAARRAGFDNVSIDLIYGANGETTGSWARTVEEAIALSPDHISAYALTIEPATPLGRKVGSGLIPAPDPDLQAEMYDLACRRLAEAGFEHYEVSNWARPNRRSAHNLGYWQGRPYLGLGAGAHSYRDSRRWWNVRPPQEYLRMVGEGRLPVGGEEVLTEEERLLERLLLGFRVADGVPEAWVERSKAEGLVADGLARWTPSGLGLTDRGMLLANDLVLTLAE
jgi:putative oxygen-independent coproporphyrinogen III oxidase